MDVIIGLILIALAIYIIYMIVVFLVHMVTALSPMVATAFVLVLAVALVFGFIRGAYKGITSYYGVLTDVYGQKAGKIIGALLTLFWASCVLLLGWNAVQSLMEFLKTMYAQIQMQMEIASAAGTIVGVL